LRNLTVRDKRAPSTIDENSEATEPGADSTYADVDGAFDAQPNDELDDGDSDSESLASSPLPTTRTHPLDAFTEPELARRLDQDPESLGSVSLGHPHAGSLFNGVVMPENEAWKLVDPKHAYGTRETVDALRLSLRAVYDRFPNTPVVSIGHLSAKHGGHLRPHRSHQSGRDVDISFYYDGTPNRWYKKALPTNLDLARTIFLIRTLVEKTSIEMILVDQSLHDPLRQYALAQGMDPASVEGWFSTREGRPPIVRHAPGHATHFHLRFRNPIAERSGQRLAALLNERRLVVVPPKTITHVARSGDTLAKLAARYGTSMHAIRVQNDMPNIQLVAGKTYRIPVANGTTQVGSRGLNTASARRNTVKK
jgi:penicillin-insensitive murein endopeptidase